MSRYAVDKLLRQLVLDPVVLEAYRSDPDASLAGHALDPEERAALRDGNYAVLYARGAHPFLLFVFLMWTRPGDPRALDAEYRAAIGPLGYPDHST